MTVKRYDPINSDGTCGTCIEDPDYGAYVEFADYEALQSLNAELLEALESTLAQCLAWQGEPDEEWSCAIHVAVCKRARAAIAKARSQA